MLFLLVDVLLSCAAGRNRKGLKLLLITWLLYLLVLVVVPLSVWGSAVALAWMHGQPLTLGQRFGDAVMFCQVSYCCTQAVEILRCIAYKRCPSWGAHLLAALVTVWLG